MAENLDNIIRENVGGPAKATVDGTTVEQQLPSEIIKADKHFGAKAAGRNPAKALVRMKIVSPGTV